MNLQRKAPSHHYRLSEHWAKSSFISLLPCLRSFSPPRDLTEYWITTHKHWGIGSAHTSVFPDDFVTVIPSQTQGQGFSLTFPLKPKCLYLCMCQYVKRLIKVKQSKEISTGLGLLDSTRPDFYMIWGRAHSIWNELQFITGLFALLKSF